MYYYIFIVKNTENSTLLAPLNLVIVDVGSHANSFYNFSSKSKKRPTKQLKKSLGTLQRPIGCKLTQANNMINPNQCLTGKCTFPKDDCKGAVTRTGL